jgi:septal ring factor EnvC (AmiA/AmiB activator)
LSAAYLFQITFRSDRPNSDVDSPRRLFANVLGALNQMTEALLVECESVRETFRVWHAEQESLDAQLSESLAALAAYQSHLDAWQQQLASERDALCASREEFERERAAADKGNVELVTELEQFRARETDLKLALDEQKRLLEGERAKWTEELRQMRETLERRKEANQARSDSPATIEPARPAARINSAESHGGNPVLGSIMEQFGKLRQQRAIDRQAQRKAR